MTGIRWTEKYRPKDLDQVLGNGKAVSLLRGWAQSWESNNPEMRGAILHGPPGVGKTSAALALAAEMSWSSIELNASDQRTAAVIEKVAGSAAKMRTFSGERRLIILDEADNLHGNADRGGMAAILKLVKNTSQPVLLLANEYYQIAKPLRETCLEIKFRAIRSTTVATVLREICEREGISCSPDAIERIALISGGDLRSAVNDLQAAAEGMTEIQQGDLATGERDTRSSIFEALGKIFRGSNPKEALETTYSLDESPEDLVHWIDENLPAAYEDEDLARGFDTLSRADLFLGRVRRRQNYGLWRYASFLMTGGIQASRTKRKGGYIAFRPPSLWRRLGQTKMARNIRDSTATKIGRHCHVSSRYAKLDLMDFFGLVLKEKELAPKVAALLDLNEDEIALLTDAKSVTKKVTAVYEEAQRLREAEADEEIELGFRGVHLTAPLASSKDSPARGFGEVLEESCARQEEGSFDSLKRRAQEPELPEDKGAGDATRAGKRGQRSLFDF